MEVWSASGWVVSSFFLGVVLFWLLLWHLPVKDKQHMDLILHYGKELAEQRQEFLAALESMAGVFKQEINLERTLSSGSSPSIDPHETKVPE